MLFCEAFVLLLLLLSSAEYLLSRVIQGYLQGNSLAGILEVQMSVVPHKSRIYRGEGRLAVRCVCTLFSCLGRGVGRVPPCVHQLSPEKDFVNNSIISSVWVTFLRFMAGGRPSLLPLLSVLMREVT